MIEIKKLVIRTVNEVKECSVQHTKDSVSQPFCTIPYNELNDGQGDVALKQAILDYMG
ncbi:MAG: hypothetical protein JKY51_04810 [Opitutaceae bacterium]|nr:hypothetical protein [Opitutaceae bacterium]